MKYVVFLQKAEPKHGDSKETVSLSDSMEVTSTHEGVKLFINEPPRGKTNNVVSEQVPHKPTCTVTEKS